MPVDRLFSDSLDTVETSDSARAGRLETPADRVVRRRAEAVAAKADAEATAHFRRAGFDLSGIVWVPPTAQEEAWHHGGWAPARRRIRESLVRCHVPASRLAAYDGCGGDTWVMRNMVTGDRRLRCNRCHDRFCEPCGRARARLIAGNVRKALTARDYLHVVLTVRHNDDPPRVQIDRLYRWFKTLRSRKVWRHYVRGGAAFLEVTRNEDTGRVHPHLHCILESRYIPIQDYAGYHRRRPVTLPGLVSTWCAITGGSTNVHVSPVTDRDAAASEVAKYVTKPLHRSLFGDPDALDRFVLAVKGKRLCLTFGSWYGIRLAERSPDFDVADWVPECSLATLVQRATSGELVAALLLEQFSRGSPCLPTPPPGQYRLLP